MPREELLSPAEEPADVDALVDEPGLRPKTLHEFVGQAELKGHLGVMLGAAKRRNEAADHLLFAGPPGLGKTTLANIIAAEMGTNLQVTSGPALERAGDLASILSKLEDGDVLFIDEIHRLPRAVEEVLYPAMEDFRIDVVLGKGPAARSIPLDLARFTLVGVIPCSSLCSACRVRRYSVTSSRRWIESVTSSQNNTHSPWMCRAARPAVWIRLVSLRRKPSLSASRMQTSDTSGKSRPSRNRLIPTRISKAAARNWRRISTRSTASTSAWM